MRTAIGIDSVAPYSARPRDWPQMAPFVIEAARLGVDDELRQHIGRAHV